MNSLYNTEEVPLNDNDREFANKIEMAYQVPYNELCQLIKELREEIDWDLNAPRYLSEFQFDEFSEKLLASDVQIKEICITTNRGVVRLRKHDLFFDRFLSACQKVIFKISRRFNLIHPYKEPSHPKFENEFGFFSIVMFFRKSALKKFQQYVAIGSFLAYFKLSEKPIRTEEEFNDDPNLTGDYKHYLYNIVKSRLKKYSR